MPHFAEWYRREEYALIREIMEDGDVFPLNFDEWEKNAESQRASAKSEGVIMMPVFLDPDEFFTFCMEQKISPTSASRAKFVISRGTAQQGLIITPPKIADT